VPVINGRDAYKRLRDVARANSNKAAADPQGNRPREAGMVLGELTLIT